MHCLGAVAGGAPSPNGAGSRSGIHSVFRALGVLVCEGRIQGPPRGYKEGPHCAPPMQVLPDEHVCEQDNYLCDRYLVLVRDIADRTAMGSFLCVEVLLCSDCPCGFAKATCKHPVFPVPSLSISPWQQTSEMLLEYWCICVVPSKSPETMNFQGLYQAVRSRLHFSQVAAWWSRSDGLDPTYIATRVVPHNEENLRKFRESPVEHTFPLAGNGNGTSIKVTVWALPRMEDVPILTCTVHPTNEKDEESVARALTPTKAIPVPPTTQNPESLVLPVLVDDRLQTPCNKPGKHHCRCEEEDVSPPSPSIPRPNGERKRRRSLPCGPADVSSSVTLQSSPLPSVQESTIAHTHLAAAATITTNTTTTTTTANIVLANRDAKDLNQSSSYPRSSCEVNAKNRVSGTSLGKSHQGQQPSQTQQQIRRSDETVMKNRNNLNSDCLERSFNAQLSIDEREGNVEKRYKRTLESTELAADAKSGGATADRDSRARKPPVVVKKESANLIGTSANNFAVVHESKPPVERNGLFENLIPFHPPSLPWSFVESWNNSGANSKCAFQNLRARDALLNDPGRTHSSTVVNKESAMDSAKQARQSSLFGDPGLMEHTGATVCGLTFRSKLDAACTVHQTCSKVNKLGGGGGTGAGAQGAVSPANEALESQATIDESSTKSLERAGKDLSHLMSKLSFPEERDRAKEEGGFLDWFSKVPGRVLGVSPSNGYNDTKAKAAYAKTQSGGEQQGSEVKFKNCNLELSQREFDEVLAVLRARTPSGRRRPVKRRGERSERSTEEGTMELEASKSPIHLENGECSPHYVATNRAKVACESCNHKFCKKNDQQVPLEKLIGLGQQQAYCNKTVCHPSYQRQQQDKQLTKASNSTETNYKCSDADKPSTPVDCLLNVSNKADVLLGAILRTSKERKGLSDISNGTRPRTVLLPTANRSEADVKPQVGGAERISEDLRFVVPFEDESRSLPMSLNRRFNRFRQLFKKEQEKKVVVMTTDDNSQERSLPQQRLNAAASPYGNVQPNLHVPRYARESKAKRKIDFSRSAEPVVEHADHQVGSSAQHGATIGPHRNARIQSTNYKEDSSSDCDEACKLAEPVPILESRERCARLVTSTKQACDKRKKEHEHEQELVPYNKLKKDPIPVTSKNNSFTPVNLQNGYSSSNTRNNNHKDGVCVEEDETLDKGVPSAIEQERFRRSLENAASMVFHSRTGLPLTSSPAPLRRGSCCFDYDSSLNSVSSKRSALFELNTPPSPGAVSLEETDRETENAGEGEEVSRRRSTSRNRPQSHALLGSFEESALNGRLEPVSTVHGFTAELGASGSFCPKHRKLPVTVFFYTLGDNDKVSTPYLAHINLGKKGYQVPRSGTIQVTLLNPLGTVVKMFVVLYDLSDMPPRSHTFLRQRTLRDKTLRYLVHLRFMSGKSGRIYLHTDIRMIICRKSDVDTASDFGSEPPKELRSYIHGPTNPKFSPRC